MPSPTIVQTAADTPAAALQKSTQTSSKKLRRPHIYELDLLRVTTSLVVVMVHVLAFTHALNDTLLGQQIHKAFEASGHFARSLFMFVTAFALVYVYNGRSNFSARQFWQKRFIGILIPYVGWSVIYVCFNQPHLAINDVITTSLTAILTGSASYQLYFILLTIQFYLLFPLFLRLLNWLKKHPWPVLTTSFLLQLALLAFSYDVIQTGSLNHIEFIKQFGYYQERMIIFYQFYFFLGSFTALYFTEVRSFLARYGRWTVLGLIVSVGALWIHFFWQVGVPPVETLGYASAPLQPVMIFYGTAVIMCLFWLAYRWCRRRDASGHPRGYSLWNKLAESSFGIYLTHALILSLVLKYVVPFLNNILLLPVTLIIAWVLTSLVSIGLSMLLARTPILSYLVGRKQPLPTWLQWKTSKQTIIKIYAMMQGDKITSGN